ncbi:hypothetical protein B0I35DRAFT_435280 [Stachybotrys elegans]|uniref:Uncharacterized protein n=1 Tax=Stachybotrys elegans TaxID=80388 RepID=A0A8K0SLU9_9HYPO|nr:hypothetical protein B0I35DRAFT_435280 [Stachybotrys elegans]
MVLKRKRSLSELCSSPESVTSTSSSSSSSYWVGSPPPLNFSIPSISISSRASMASPAHLDSRTMKRFRDNRPSEDEIYQRTLGLLYSAQQRQQHVSQPTQSSLAHKPSHNPATSNQQSLHRFWNIGSQPKSAPPPAPVTEPAMAPVNCEDCGAGLCDGEDGMMLDGESNACGACGKHVCFSCSVSTLGENKRCLQCAGTHVGNGMEWTSTGLSVF